MNNKTSCNHSPCLKGKIATEYLNESEELFQVAQSCDACLKELMALETSIHVARLGNRNATNMQSYPNFNEELDIHRAEMLLSPELNQPIPDHLQRYMELSFSQKPDENADSIIVKLSRSGIKFVDSLIENMSIIPTVNYAPAMRSAITETPESFIVLEEKMDSGTKVTYQIIQESHEDAFLSIKVDTEDQEEIFQQANLRKEGRFIQSSRFNQDNTVSFSGLKDGKYNIELTTGKNSKKIDFIILID